MVKKVARIGWGMIKGYLVTVAMILSIQYLIVWGSPRSLRFTYEKVEPARAVFCLWENPSFTSYSRVNRVPTYMEWNDVQFCDIDSKDDDDHRAYYNNNVTSLFVTTAHNRLLSGRLWYYGNTWPSEPATCFMQHEIKALVAFGEKKTQVIRGDTYRYEDCNTPAVYTGELQGE